MNKKKLFAVALALLLCAGLMTPAWAGSGYSSGPWTSPGSNIPGYVPGYGGGGGYSSSGEGQTLSAWERVLANGGALTSSRTTTSTTVTIEDADTPLSGAHACYVKLQEDYGATPLTSGSKAAQSGTALRFTGISVVAMDLIDNFTNLLYFDTVENSAVMGRFYINPTLIDTTTHRDISVAMSFDEADAGVVLKTFQKYFSGNFAVVSLAQKCDCGHDAAFGVRVAIHVSKLKGVDLDNLVVLSYDKTLNSYKKIPAENVTLSGNYVYIDTAHAGELVFTDSSVF